MASKSTAKKTDLETLLIASKVREAVKAADCNFAGDALEGLNTLVHELVDRAVHRAKENGRKTVRGSDF